MRRRTPPSPSVRELVGPRRRVAAVALAAGATVALAGCSQLEIAGESTSTTSTTSAETSASTSPSSQPSSPRSPAAPSTPSSSPVAPPPPAPGDPAAPPAPGDPAVPPAAPAEVDPQQRDNFIALTDQLGASMPEGTDPVGVITEACGQLDNDAPVGDVLGFVADKGGYDANKASFFLAGGVPVFCSGNTAKLTG